MRHGDTRSESHFLRPWVTPGGLKVATFCMRNSLHTQTSFNPWNLGEGHLGSAATYKTPPCATDPKTSEESRNGHMKSAGRTSNMRRIGGTRRLQTTQEKGRLFLSS